MAETRTTSSTGGQKGVKLERHDLIPIGPLKALATHYGRGARKYANHQWRQGYEWSKSYAAMVRHQTDFWSGKDYDVCSNDPDGCRHTDMDGNPFDTGEPDTCFNHTGSHHMIAAAWHAFCLFEFAMHHPNHDDRFETETWIDYDKITDEIIAGRGPLLSPEHWEKVRALADKDPVDQPDCDPNDAWMHNQVAVRRHPCYVEPVFQNAFFTEPPEVTAGRTLGFEVELRPEPGTALRSVQEALDRRG